MDNNSKISQFIANKDNDGLISTLKLMHIIKINPVTSQPIPLNVSNEDISILNKTLNYAKENFSSNKDIIHETLRCLRNCVILNTEVQNQIIRTEILNLSQALLESLINEEKQDNNKCLKMLLLFLTNLCVNNPNTGKVVWEKVAEKLLILLDRKILINNTAALVYNILCKNSTILLEQPLLVTILNLLEEQHESEYLCFLLEHFIQNNQLVTHHQELKLEHRMIILEELRELVVQKNEDIIANDYLLILVDDFKKKSDCILKTVTDYLKTIEPLEVSMLLDIIASCSSKEHHLKILQNDRSLLINSMFLLKSIHSVGKEGDNYFTAIQKLSEMNLGDESVREHPAFGFKVSLIRILGNLAWKNRPNQDEMRELECIPLLLDCCNIDARNPFIIQWVVFAIRNLCEKNQANQQVIAALNKKGVVDSSTLHELGITLHGDGGSEVKIAPLVLNK